MVGISLSRSANEVLYSSNDIVADPKKIAELSPTFLEASVKTLIIMALIEINNDLKGNNRIFINKT